MNLNLESLTSDPSGSENGLIVRNIPSGVQTIDGSVNLISDGYITTSPITDVRTVRNFSGFISGITSETMITLNSYLNFSSTGSGTSFGISSGKKFRLQSFSANPGYFNSYGGIIILRASNSGSVSTSSTIVSTLNLIAPQGVREINFGDGIEFSENMEIGVSFLTFNSDHGAYISLVGYEY